jgi:signal transduction histidine kinase
MQSLQDSEILMKQNRILAKIRASQIREWFRFLGEARTRILIWYILLLLFFLGVAIPAFRQRLFARIDARVRADLAEEMEEFQVLLVNGLTPKDDPGSNRSQSSNRIIPAQAPTNQRQLRDVFEAYLERRLPEDDTYLIALLNGQLYKSSPRALPAVLRTGSALMQAWVRLNQPQEGEQETADSAVGSVLYLAHPIKLNDGTSATFIVAHTTAGERAEALESISAIVEVSVVVFALALLLAWLAAGKVLAPLHLLTKTANAISETDLHRRIPVQGSNEIAELAKTFNEMMDRLEVAFETQRNFINDAGHELRTPITIIRGHLEVMGDDPQEQQETLALVMDELDRMGRQVNDLMLLAKAERPDFLQLETVEISTLTEELFAKAQALADRNWQLEAMAMGRTIVVDRQRITDAIMNLAQNATQHTKPGDIIALGSEVRQTEVRLWVRDTGEGIAPADQHRIFQRFARAANSRRRSEGAGLGLAIVQAIAEAHGGQVMLRSQLGAGATFTLVLPLEPSTEIKRQLLSYASDSHR